MPSRCVGTRSRARIAARRVRGRDVSSTDPAARLSFCARRLQASSGSRGRYRGRRFTAAHVARRRFSPARRSESQDSSTWRGQADAPDGCGSVSALAQVAVRVGQLSDREGFDHELGRRKFGGALGREVVLDVASTSGLGWSWNHSALSCGVSASPALTKTGGRPARSACGGLANGSVRGFRLESPHRFRTEVMARFPPAKSPEVTVSSGR